MSGFVCRMWENGVCSVLLDPASFETAFCWKGLCHVPQSSGERCSLAKCSRRSTCVHRCHGTVRQANTRKIETRMGFWVTLVWFLGALSELVTASEPPPTVTSGRFTSTSATTKTYPLSRRFLQHNTKLNILVSSHERSILNVASWATTPVRRPRRFLTDSTQYECRAFFLEHG